MERIKQIILSNKYIPIDMTLKIKNKLDIELHVIMKAHNKKYNKVVFIIDVKQIPKPVVKFLQLNNQLPQDDYNDCILLYNKQSFQYVFSSIYFSDASISNFFLDDGSNACDICFEEDLRHFRCRSCSTKTCFNCIRKMGIPKICSVCKLET